MAKLARTALLYETKRLIVQENIQACEKIRVPQLAQSDRERYNLC